MELAHRVKEVLSRRNFQSTDKPNLLNLYKEVFGVSLNHECSSCVYDAWYGLKDWFENIGQGDIKINLFVPVYESENKARQKELDFCLKFNKESGFFSNVIIIPEPRRTFKEMLELTTNYPYDINIISNADIFFNHTILQTKFMQKGECYALSRWDYVSGGFIKHFDRNDSQDVWVFNGVAKCDNATYTMGVAGCDNRLAYDLREAGYLLSNPSKKIKPIHLHLTEHRTYNNQSYVIPKPYFLIPTSY